MPCDRCLGNMPFVSPVTLLQQKYTAGQVVVPPTSACNEQTTIQLLTKAWSIPRLLHSEVDIVKEAAR